MRNTISLILLAIIALGIAISLQKIPFSVPKTKMGRYYIDTGRKETGATNIVTSVVVNYRGFDTLGEVTVLFIAAIGLGAVFAVRRNPKANRHVEPASLVLYTGCRFLFPLILLFGAYTFIHGHLTPGAVFFLSIYDDWGKRKLSYFESLGLKTHIIRKVSLEEKGISASEIRNFMINNQPWEHLLPRSVAGLMKQWKIPERLKKLNQNCNHSDKSFHP